MKNYSFTQKVKDELVDKDQGYSLEKKKAILSGFIRVNGHVSFQNKKSILLLNSLNANVLKFVYTTIKEIYVTESRFIYEKDNSTSSTRFNLKIEDRVDEILEDLNISFLEGKISKNIAYNNETISGFLVGVFLASGSINSPLTSNYHFELTLNNENFAKWFIKLLNKNTKANFEPKLIKRRNNYVVYFKKSDTIASLLAFMGASICCLEFEDVRVNRDYVNNFNRITNFDTANMVRTIETGAKQAEEIKKIDEVIGIDNLSNENLKLVAHLRLENPNASLLDLSKLMSEYLNKPVSKSMVNHLMRSIKKTYERIK
ncbi:MAG: DNA-binding protein WhiA [Bacilli bacterium]